MMGTIYDAAAPAGAKRGNPARQAYADLPDVYNPPRRRWHPVVNAMLMFVGTSGVFYGAESILPTQYKPSHFIGGYDQQIAKAKAEGELSARIGYDGKLKLIETAANQFQERCRASLHNYNNFYQAAYTRANAGFNLAASIQQQYTSARFSTAQASTGGEVTIANAATTFGYILGLLDPETGQKALDLAELARTSALKKLDDAARGGVQVSTDGWNTGLPDPASLPQPMKCDLPSALTAAQPSKEG